MKLALPIAHDAHRLDATWRAHLVERVAGLESAEPHAAANAVSRIEPEIAVTVISDALRDAIAVSRTKSLAFRGGIAAGIVILTLGAGYGHFHLMFAATLGVFLFTIANVVRETRQALPKSTAGRIARLTAAVIGIAPRVGALDAAEALITARMDAASLQTVPARALDDALILALGRLDRDETVRLSTSAIVSLRRLGLGATRSHVSGPLMVAALLILAELAAEGKLGDCHGLHRDVARLAQDRNTPERTRAAAEEFLRAVQAIS